MAAMILTPLRIPAGNTVFYSLKADRASCPIYEGGVAVRKSGKVMAVKGHTRYWFTAKTVPRTKKGPAGTLRYMGNDFPHYNEKLTAYIEKHIGEKTIDISDFRLKNTACIAEAVRLARMRHPEHADITGNITCTSVDGIYTEVTIKRSSADVAETDRAAAKVARSARKYRTKTQQVQYVRRYLSGIKYGESKYAYNAYGALVKKKAVCQGKAEAFYLIMSKLGIKARYDAEPKIDHIWNQVKINGKWYSVDATWSTKKFIYDETLLTGRRLR